MIDFSLILNSRGRPKLLKGLLESIKNTTIVQDKIEILVRVDNDDIQYSKDFLNDLCDKYEWLRFYFGDRVRNVHISLNELANSAIGRFIWILNDDCEILTLGWDDIVRSKIYQYKLENKIKNDIFLGLTSCNSVDRSPKLPYSSFPVVSREAFNVLGFTMYNSLPGLYGDTTIYRLYESINRLVDLREIKIDHKTHSSLDRVRNPDETGFFVRLNTYNNNIDPFAFDVSKESKKLKEYIEENNKK